MNATPEQPKRRGRPSVPADQRLTERAEIRLSQAERLKFDALGGAEWVRCALKKARLPAA
jgi:hypothetical protein